jgi:polysaccharide export outer membrane protein
VEENIPLQNGDTILIPKAQGFFVLGEVKSPGAYKLDHETTILEGITLAGGFTNIASPGRTRIIRTTPKGEEVIQVDMNEIIKQGRRDKAIRLRENDVIVVPESFF